MEFNNNSSVNNFNQSMEPSANLIKPIPETVSESLVNKNLQTELESKLINTMLGGYSKKSVESFVAEMHSNFNQIKVGLEQQIHDLAAEKASISQECSVLREQLKVAEVNLLEVQNQIFMQEDIEKELKISQEENEELKKVVSDYQDVRKQKAQYEELLTQKELKINKLTNQIEAYEKDYEALREKTKTLEDSFSEFSSRPSEVELTHIRLQKQEIEKQYQTLLQRFQVAELELKQKQSSLDETQSQLQMERAKIQELEELSKSRTLTDQLSNDQQSLQDGTESFHNLLVEKDQQLKETKRICQDQLKYNHDLEVKVDSLYQNYFQSTEKVQQLERMISEKDLLLHHYQKHEQDNGIIRQENVQARRLITSLKEAVHKIMREMETQSDGLNQYAARMIQEREALKLTISKQAELKLHNAELIDQHNQIVTQLETLKLENTRLRSSLEDQKRLAEGHENNNKIVNLDDFTDAEAAEVPIEEPELQICNAAYQKAKELIKQLHSLSGNEEEYWLDQDYK